MNDTKPNGGPAFPIPHTIADANDPAFKRGNGGMFIRDYFAGQALTGLLTQLAEDEFGPSHFAKASYEMADAMIAARNS